MGVCSLTTNTTNVHGHFGIPKNESESLQDGVKTKGSALTTELPCEPVHAHNPARRRPRKRCEEKAPAISCSKDRMARPHAPLWHGGRSGLSRRESLSPCSGRCLRGVCALPHSLSRVTCTGRRGRVRSPADRSRIHRAPRKDRPALDVPAHCYPPAPGSSPATSQSSRHLSQESSLQSH